MMQHAPRAEPKIPGTIFSDLQRKQQNNKQTKTKDSYLPSKSSHSFLLFFNKQVNCIIILILIFIFFSTNEPFQDLSFGLSILPSRTTTSTLTPDLRFAHRLLPPPFLYSLPVIRFPFPVSRNTSI